MAGDQCGQQTDGK